MLKVLRVILLSCLAFGLFACGGGGGGGGSTASAPNGNFNLSTNSLSFSGSNGSSYIPSQYVYLTALGPDAYNVYVGTPVGVSWPSWLDASLYATSTTAGYAVVTANPYGLAPGTYSTTLRVLTTDSKDNPLVYKDVSVTLTVTGSSSSSSSSSAFSSSSSSFTSTSSSSSSVAPAISASPASLSLGGSSGRSFSSASTLNVTANKAGVWSWGVQSKPAWLTVVSGSSGILSGTTPLQFQADPSMLSAGSYSGTLVLQATVSGTLVTTSVPVSVNVDKRKLIASEIGVALTKTPDWSRLTHTVTIRDNFGSGSWTASTNKAWLSVTSSGSSGGTLSLTANPAGLTADQLSIATVTITSDNGAAPETIQVGLWNSSTTPSDQIIINKPYWQMVTDPVRPWVYVNDYGSDTDITIYNVYTGTVVGAISGLESYTRVMEISPDGKRLYVAQSGGIAVVDPETRTKLTTWVGPTLPRSLIYVRPNGEGFLMRDQGTAFRASTGASISIASLYLSSNAFLAVTHDNSTLFTAENTVSPAQMLRYSLDYSDETGSLSVVSASGTSMWGSACYSGAITLDDSQIIHACSAPYSYTFPRFSLPSFGLIDQLTAGAVPSIVRVGSDGRIFAGSINSVFYWTDPYDLQIYRTDGTLSGQYKVHKSTDTTTGVWQLSVSGDGMIAAIITGERALRLVPVGPDTSSSSALPVGVSASSSSNAGTFPLSNVRQKIKLSK